MGNPKGVTTAPHSLACGVNGILAAVPGECIAAASQLLPPAATMQGQTVRVDADGGHAGPVRFTYVAMSSVHGRSARRWFWVAKHAESLTSPSPVASPTAQPAPDRPTAPGALP